MNSFGKWLAVIGFVLVSLLDVSAATLAGVSLPDTAQVGSTRLVLNGLGLRKKFVVKVYVAGLYLEQKSSDAEAILGAEAPKRIVMHFLHGASKKQIADAFDESLTTNAPNATKTMRADVDRLLAALEPVNEGSQMVFTYLPGRGTTLTIDGRDKLTIAAPAFGPAIMSVWLGPKPPNADLKTGLLGQRP